MFDYIYGDENYPLICLWMEYNQPLTIDGVSSFEGSIPMRYRRVQNTSHKLQDIVGLKATSNLTTIRTKDDLMFKAKDKIKIDNKNYIIKSSNRVENDVYKGARIVYTHFVDYETELVLE